MRTRALAAAFALVAPFTLGACGGSGGSDTARTGEVTGVVLAAPACPVERVDEPCPPRPVAGALVEAMDGDDVRASTRTDDDGAFRLSLPEGTYLVQATNTGGLPTTATEQVTVGGTPVEVELVVDSGIR